MKRIVTVTTLTLAAYLSSFCSFTYAAPDPLNESCIKTWKNSRAANTCGIATASNKQFPGYRVFGCDYPTLGEKATITTTKDGLCHVKVRCFSGGTTRVYKYNRPDFRYNVKNCNLTSTKYSPTNTSKFPHNINGVLKGGL